MTELNATMGVASLAYNMNGTTSWFSLVILVGLVCIVLGVMVSALSGIKGFSRVKKLFLWLGKTFYYFGYGILAIVCFAIPISIIWWLEKEAVNGNTIPLKWIGYVILGYVLISFIGWMFKKLIERVKRLNKLSGKKR